MSSREDWQRRLGPLYGGAVALVHSTPWRWPTEARDDARASGWIIALGVPIGLVAWVVAAVVRAAGLPSTIAALLALGMLTLSSAALIERGVVERIDHWQGRRESPGVGSILVLVFMTLVRTFAIVSLPQSKWLLVLIATAVVGRWAAVFLQSLGEPIAQDVSGRSLVATPTPAWLTAALSAGVAVIGVFALGKAAIVALALAAIAAFALGLEAQRRDGGLSAPIVAVAAAIGELAVLLVATLGQ